MDISLQKLMLIKIVALSIYQKTLLSTCHLDFSSLGGNRVTT